MAPGGAARHPGAVTRPTRGAVAGGHALTVRAGLDALERGGNAFDAAVAAQIMACVCESTMTGLGAGGLALLRVGGPDPTTEVLDFFPDVPGLGRSTPPGPMDDVVVSFEADEQVFRAGPSSVAAPGMAPALQELHDRYGTLPWADLLAGAIAAASDATRVNVGMGRSIQVCWPILRRDPTLREAYGKQIGDTWVAKSHGDDILIPGLAGTLRRVAHEGPDFLAHGDGAEALLRRLGPDATLTAQDLASARARHSTPLRLPFGGGQLLVPGAPSQAGPLLLASLRALAPGSGEAPNSAARLTRVADALRAAEDLRDRAFLASLGTPGFVEGWLGKVPGSGFTTHLSTIDEHGNAVAITSSLGETAGIHVPETGVVPNNFLGEDDVFPPALGLRAGERLLTMCCPTLWEGPRGIVALGTGGSSRIRSAILQVLLALADGLDVTEAVCLPRCHYEGGILRAENAHRPPGWLEQLPPRFGKPVVFPDLALFFGGVHLVGLAGERLFGAGDPRRSGAFGAS